MGAGIIARPGGSIKATEEATPCGCEVVGGRALLRCGDADYLWALLVDARDAVRGGEEARRLRLPGARSGAKARLDRFAECRDLYHAHVRAPR